MRLKNIKAGSAANQNTFVFNGSIWSPGTPSTGGVHVQQNSDGNSTTTSTAFPGLTKVTLTTPSLAAGDYKVFWKYQWAINDAGGTRFDARVILDDTTVIHSITRDGVGITGTTARNPVGGSKKVTFTSGVHTIKLQFKTSSSSFVAAMKEAQLILVSI